MRITLLLGAAIFAALATVLSGCDPTCEETTIVKIVNTTGRCYDVTVNDREESFNLNTTICSTEEHEVLPSTYDYTVSADGVEVLSGTKTVGCGETVTITLSGGTPDPQPTPNPTPTAISVNGTPTAPDDGFLYCGITNPRNQPATAQYTQYSLRCGSGSLYQPNVTCSGNCGVPASASVLMGKYAQNPCYYEGGVYWPSSTCNVRLKY